MANTKRFHRHFETPGQTLYWIIIAYIILGWFFPVIGLLAIICMIGPVVTSIFKGRWWCGHVCPRGNMYDRLLSKVVRTCVSSWQYVRQIALEVFTPSSDSQVCANLRLSSVHGVLHLHYVWHTTKLCALERGWTSHVGWYRQGLLDDYRHDYHRWCHAFFHLCTTHMVFVLSNGNHLQLGST